MLIRWGQAGDPGDEQIIPRCAQGLRELDNAADFYLTDDLGFGAGVYWAV